MTSERRARGPGTSRPVPTRSESAASEAIEAPNAAELEEDLTLVDLVNLVLDRGVVVQGEAVIGVAGVDLVYLGLQVMLSSVETMTRQVRSGQAAKERPVR